MKNFKNLNVWQKSHQLALSVYKNTSDFPKSEVYGLTSQIRRSAVSVPSNIVEGCGRNSDAELRRFLTIAHGSAAELSYQLFLSYELNFLPKDIHETLDVECTEIMKMLNSFIQRL